MIQNLTINNMNFLHKNIHKMAWRSPDNQTENHIDNCATKS